MSFLKEHLTPSTDTSTKVAKVPARVNKNIICKLEKILENYE